MLPFSAVTDPAQVQFHTSMIETRRDLQNIRAATFAPLKGRTLNPVRQFLYVASNEDNISKEQLCYTKETAPAG